MVPVHIELGIHGAADMLRDPGYSCRALLLSRVGGGIYSCHCTGISCQHNSIFNLEKLLISTLCFVGDKVDDNISFVNFPGTFLF